MRVERDTVSDKWNSLQSDLEGMEENVMSLFANLGPESSGCKSVVQVADAATECSAMALWTEFNYFALYVVYVS